MKLFSINFCEKTRHSARVGFEEWLINNALSERIFQVS